MWSLVVVSLLSLVQPYQEINFQGLINQESPWDCGPAVAASLVQLTEQTPLAWPSDEQKGASLLELVHYFEAHGIKSEAYRVEWEQLLFFFLNFPGRPIITHSEQEQGHYTILLGMLEQWIVVFDPNWGIRAVQPNLFLDHFSGTILHFPTLPELPGVQEKLALVNARLELLRQTVTN